MSFISKEDYSKYETNIYNTLINNLNKRINLFFDFDEFGLKNYVTVNYKIINDTYFWFLKNQIENNYQYLFGLATKDEICSNKQKNNLLKPNIIISVNSDRNKTGLRFYKSNNEIKCLIRLNNDNLNKNLEILKKKFLVKNSTLKLKSGDHISEKYIDLGNIESGDIIKKLYCLLMDFDFDLYSNEYINIIYDDNGLLDIDKKVSEKNDSEIISNSETSFKNTKICKICNEEKELHNYYKNNDRYDDICIKCNERNEAAEYLDNFLEIYKPEERFNQTQFLNQFPEKEEQLNVLKETDLITYDFENDECIMPYSLVIHKFKNKHKELINLFNENNKVSEKNIENKFISTSSFKDNFNNKYRIIDKEGHIRERTHNIKLKFTVLELYKIKFFLNKDVPIQKIADYIGDSYANINNNKLKLLNGEFDEVIEKYGNSYDLSDYDLELQEVYENSFNKDKYEIIDKEGHVKKKGGPQLSLTIYQLYEIKNLMDGNISISKLSDKFDVGYQTINRCINLIKKGEFNELFNNDELNFKEFSTKESKNEFTIGEEIYEDGGVECVDVENITESFGEKINKKFVFLPFNNQFMVKISCIISNEEIVETLSIIEHLKAAFDVKIKQILVMDIGENIFKTTMDLIINQENKEYTSIILNNKGFEESK